MKDRMKTVSKFYRVQTNGLVMIALPFLVLTTYMRELVPILLCLLIVFISILSCLSFESKSLFKNHTRYRLEVIILNVISVLTILFLSKEIGVVMACAFGFYVGLMTLQYADSLRLYCYDTDGE